MPNERDETLEVLVIRGRLDRAGRFTPTRCRSTYNVREWPVVEASDHVVETVDPEDRTLHRELALVRPDIGCDPGDPQRYRLLAYIGLHPDAASVRLRRDDLVLWRTEIPPPAKVTVGLERSRPSRGKRYPLRVRFSEPGERAHLTVVYQWGPRQFRPIYIGPPRETVPIDLSELPGGEECRFVVMYSNGLRSAGDATRTFAVPPLGPSVSLARPTKGERVIAGTPLIFEGHVSDPERPRGPNPDEDLVWLLDSEVVATGPIASVDGLTPGRHRLTLSYRSEPAAEESVELRATKPEQTPANEWDEWDPADDDARWSGRGGTESPNAQ